MWASTTYQVNFTMKLQLHHSPVAVEYLVVPEHASSHFWIIPYVYRVVWGPDQYTSGMTVTFIRSDDSSWGPCRHYSVRAVIQEWGKVLPCLEYSTQVIL